MNLFQKISEGLKKTRERLGDGLAALFRKERTDSFYTELEDLLLSADVGPAQATLLISDLKEWEKSSDRITQLDPTVFLEERIASFFPLDPPLWVVRPELTPTIILMVGVNGVGKTTTAGKLAHLFKSQGKSVLLGAADTFRAAAVHQLKLWGEKLDVPVIHQKEGADPGAVAFDTVKAAVARKIDVAIIDTAGRLQTKHNLMAELGKVHGLVKREMGERAFESLIVLDATLGQNTTSQIENFQKIIPLTGIILTKLDGTSKGGIAVSLARKYRLPVRFVGVGEKKEDLLSFDPVLFARALIQPNTTEQQ
ncbi:MAG: signal recognition particle-docking protein FtsY [Leptospirales bacterium]